MLSETQRGYRRLFSQGDRCHPARTNGKLQPKRFEVPEHYCPLVDCYEQVYGRETRRRARGNRGQENGIAVRSEQKRETQEQHLADIFPERLREMVAAFVRQIQGRD